MRLILLSYDYEIVLSLLNHLTLYFNSERNENTMRKEIKLLTVFIFLVAFVICLSVAGDAFAALNDVSGFLAPIGAPDPNAIKIYTAQDLYNVRNNLNGSYVLMNDIDLAGYNGGQWVPIGDSIWSNELQNAFGQFTGTFDGQGNVIKNLKISGNKYDYNGLFGYVESAAVIKNVGLEGTDINVTRTSATEGSFSAVAYVGGVCGYIRGNSTIYNCYNIGNVVASASYSRATSQVGGICGYVIASVSYCYNEGNISSSASASSSYSSSSAGGISGFRGTISNCYNTGDVSSSASSFGTYAAESYAGGICGDNTISITNCYNKGKVTASSPMAPRAGGICGDSEAIISNCYNTGSVSTTNTSTSNGGHTGGICGVQHSPGSIYNCYNTGTVNDAFAAGGICGANYGDSSISNCYNAGDVLSYYSSPSSSFGPYAGGICGANEGNGTISNCVVLANRIYAENLQNPGPVRCRLIGSDFDDTNTNKIIKTNNLALTDIQGNPTNDATRRVSLTEAKNQSTYELLGWNFNTVWRMVLGYDYPQLLSLLSVEPVVFHKVTFSDWDGKELKTQEVEHGNAATAPTNPERVGYTFIGWDKDFSNITEDLIIMAQYAEGNVITFTVTFADWDGRELKTQTVERGKAASAPINPTREGYIFIGWDRNFSNITEDLTVFALYEADEFSNKFPEPIRLPPIITPGGYIINIATYEGGTVLSELLDGFNNIVMLTAIPDEGYTFVGWYEDGSSIPVETSETYTFIATADRDLIARYSLASDVIDSNIRSGGGGGGGCSAYSYLSLTLFGIVPFVIRKKH